MLKGIQPRLCELGKIKIGRKEEKERVSEKGTRWRAPEKLDHFLITTLDRDQKGDLRVDAPLMKRLGEATGSQDGKVREIPISLLSDNIDEVLSAAYCWYDSKRIAARCNGEICTWYRDNKGNSIPEGRAVACNGEHDKMRDPKGYARFKVHGTLCCVIAAGEARWGGVYKFRTTSRISLEQLYGSLQHLQVLTNGILRGLPLRLVLRPIQVNPVVNGKQTSSTIYVVHAELRGPDLNTIQQQAIQIAQARNANAAQLKAVQHEYVKLLCAPGVNEDFDEQEDVAAEFHPSPENNAVPQNPPESIADEIDHDEDGVVAEPSGPTEESPWKEPAQAEPVVFSKIAQAKTNDELKALVPEIRALPEEQQSQAKALYTERSNAIRQASKNGVSKEVTPCLN